MCMKCAEIERRIEHLRKLAFGARDVETLDRIPALIADLEAQKIALRPERHISGA